MTYETIVIAPVLVVADEALPPIASEDVIARTIVRLSEQIARKFAADGLATPGGLESGLKIRLVVKAEVVAYTRPMTPRLSDEQWQKHVDAADGSPLALAWQRAE